MDLHEVLDGFDRRDWQRAESGTVRIATVGMGWWTRERAIPAIETSDFCRATVAVSGEREKAESMVRDVDSVEQALTYEEFHDGAAADEYDAIYVSTPNAVHLPYVESAAELGKHVLCEKPMEASVERAESMVDVCEGTDVKLMIGYRMQTEPAIRRARELVEEGAIGDPVQVQGYMAQRLLEMNPDPDQWRLDPELVGEGGSVTDLGIYPINTARFVLDADPVAVHAMMGSPTDEFRSIPDERASFGFELDRDVFAACAASQNAHDGGRFTVIGTEGTIALEPAFFGDENRTLTVERGDASMEIQSEGVDQMTEEFDYFADRILTNRDVDPDGNHGLTDMRTIHAIYEAARTEGRVEVA